MPFLTFSCQFNWELTFRQEARWTVVWGGGIDPIRRVNSDYTQLNHRWIIIPRPHFHFYNILNTMTWNLYMFMYHSLSTAWHYPRHSSHTKEKGQAHFQTPINAHYANWQPSSSHTLMYTGYSPSVTTSKPATMYTHSFGGLSSSEPSLQVITPLNSSISVIIPSTDTQHHTTESHWLSESNVFSLPVEQGSKIPENETPLKVGQEAGDEVGAQG